MQKAFNILILTLLLGLAACSGSDGPNDPGPTTDGEALRLTATLRVPSTRYASIDTPGEDPGTEEECNIPKEENLKILVFDAATNTYITSLGIVSLTPKASGDYTEYELEANAYGLDRGMKVRFVALANWPTALDSKTLEVGKTTIDDICGDNALVFDASAYAGKTLGTHFYMPMYGAEARQLAFDSKGWYAGEPIIFYMLRALAKVEVVVQERSQYDLASVKIVNWNKQAFCAPWRCYDRLSYRPDDQSQGWYTDLHIPKQDLMSTPFSFLGTNDTEFPASNPIADKTRHIFTAYLPEIKNNSEVPEASRPYLLLTFKGLDGKTYEVKFENHDGQTESEKGLYSLHRNWWYRLSVSKSGPLEVTITLAPYTGIDLKPLFGFTELVHIEHDFNYSDSGSKEDAEGFFPKN